MAKIRLPSDVPVEPAPQTQDPPAPERMPAAVDLPQSVTLEAFCRNTWGPKHQDQAGGFLHWARRNGHQRYSVVQWQALLAQFNNRPVGMQ